MEYRPLPGEPGVRLSALGFACARLPTLPGDAARVDEDAAARLLHQAVDSGVNYVDTSWSDHRGESEFFLGRALAGGWRGKVRLATKLPVGLVKSEDDWERFLDAQLERLATDHLDFYLLHGLDRDRWELVKRLGGPSALERARADGRVERVGFTLGGSPEEFAEIVLGHDWDLCQVPLNLLDAESQVGRAGLGLASARGVGVVALAPLRGGAIARPPPVVEEAWSGSDRSWPPAEWALRWALSHREVTSALCGTRDATHLQENLRAASDATPFGPAEQERVAEVRQTYRTRRRVPCTSCGACQVCAHQIPVSNVFSLYNDAMFESRTDAAAEYLRAFLELGAGADQCDACGTCLPMCPAGISIPEKLREAHAYLTT